MNKRNLIIGIVALIALVGGVVLYVASQSRKTAEVKQNNAEKTKEDAKETKKQTQEQATVQKQKTTKEQTTNQNQTINGELKPEEKIDTSDWKTYRNREYGFEFKYPKDWEVERLKNVTAMLYDGLALNVIPRKHPINNKLIFGIAKFNTSLSPRQWYIKHIDNPDTSSEEFGKIMKINNFDAYYVFEDKSYKSMNYVVKISPNLILLFTFRPLSNDIPYNFTKYIPHFKTMVWSLKRIK